MIFAVASILSCAITIAASCGVTPSVSDLEKMVINKDDLSVYNYFSLRKNRKKKIIFYLIPFTFILLTSYIAYKYWPLINLKDLFLK